MVATILVARGVWTLVRSMNVRQAVAISSHHVETKDSAQERLGLLAERLLAIGCWNS